MVMDILLHRLISYGEDLYTRTVEVYLTVGTSEVKDNSVSLKPHISLQRQISEDRYTRF